MYHCSDDVLNSSKLFCFAKISADNILPINRILPTLANNPTPMAVNATMNIESLKRIIKYSAGTLFIAQWGVQPFISVKKAVIFSSPFVIQCSRKHPFRIK